MTKILHDVTEGGEKPAGIDCCEFHELARDYRGVSPFRGAQKAYKALCDYVDTRMAAASPNAALVEALKAYRNAQAMHPDMYRREDALRDADELARAALAAAGVQP